MTPVETYMEQLREIRSAIHNACAVPGGALYSIASGDFNGDGHPDLVVADLYSASIAILLGNGDGGFQPPEYYRAPRGALVKVADINGTATWT